MGSLSEFFRFMEEEPKKLHETVKTFSHISFTEKMKDARSELKLYKKQEVEKNKQHELNL